jgi:hypothetical protein
LGWKDYATKDKEVQDFVEKMKSHPDRFIFLKNPEKNFISWYQKVQKEYQIKPYLNIEKPDLYVYQNRYQADDGSEMLFLINSHIHNSHQTRVTFSFEMTRGKYGWIWNAETGERFRVTLSKENSIDLDLGPAESLIFVFDKNKTVLHGIPCRLRAPRRKS